MSDEQKALQYLKRALVDLSKTRQRLHEAESRFAEPIAVVGMGCRYPGGVRSPDDLWELVSLGRDAISDLPDNRGWDMEQLSSNGDSERLGSVCQGGFLHEAGDFDAGFFGIDEREALMMDPQQQLLLETTWEACENAGIDPTALRGSSAGVFVGVSTQNYAAWLFGAVPEDSEGYFALGNSGCMASGRVAHVLGLEGPAITLDTGCSSSAAALHLACQSLRVRECSMALAGGVAVITTPWLYVEASRQHLFTLARDGRCKPFADSADGTVFSEGVGIAVLERLSDAHRMGHDVLAVIRGSAMNQDGASNGLTAPNGLAHERVIRQALSSSGVSARQVDAVEAHGMGTALGDPIEAQALLATYGQAHGEERPLWVGSLKSNIGHTQAAGGIGGVIKMVMAMRHEQLPKTLHADVPSRHVDWSSGNISLLAESVPWKTTGDLRRAAVHSFGMSGTNVHIILQEPTSAETAVESAPQAQRRDFGCAGAVVPWALSGRGEEGLRRQARRLADFVEARPQLGVADIGYSLAVSRAALSHRAVLVGSGREQLIAALTAVADGRSTEKAIKGVAHAGHGSVAFVCGEGGRLLIGAATRLFEASSLFAVEMRRIDEALSPHIHRPLCDLLHDGVKSWELEGSGTVDLMDFAVTASSMALWRACRIEPSAVVGYGKGEIAAAYVAGALTIEDAAQMLARGDSKSPSVARLRRADMPLWLCSTGGLAGATELDSGCLARGASEHSYMEEVAKALRAQGCRTFVEFGAVSILPPAVRSGAVVVPAMQLAGGELWGILASLGQLWVAGMTVDWGAAFAGLGVQRVGLPTYAFDSRRYWLEHSPTWVERPPFGLTPPHKYAKIGGT